MALVSGPQLRDMKPEDLPEVLAIERASFPSPWTKGMFEAELGHPFSWHRVAMADAGPVAFLIARFYGEVWHIMDLAVAPAQHRRGLGGMLLDEFLSHVPPDEPIILEVREGNEKAISLYRSRGFRESGRRPGYYPDTGESALLMVRGPEVAW
jgi:ribosomal-protein-alanine N-acetyltransferase